MMHDTSQTILDVKNLRTHFNTKQVGRKVLVKAVDDISFSINRGETFGLVGESGCGKTTTGRTIIRLYKPTSGEIYFEGRRIDGNTPRDDLNHITSRMQMIFQDPVASLNPRMTIEEIIGEGLKVQGMKNRTERLEIIYEMLDKVGLTKEHASRYPHEFSGGQRQRIGIARALVSKPSLIIADEPVSALDVSIQAQVINLLNRLKEEMGLTVLFIAHDLSIVKYFSDRIGVMYYGKLVEMAEADELYEHPIHPYTKALLSAIPQPDPIYEKSRRRILYDPSVHEYHTESPEYHEIRPNHFVYASASEAGRYREALGVQ